MWIFRNLRKPLVKQENVFFFQEIITKICLVLRYIFLNMRQFICPVGRKNVLAEFKDLFLKTRFFTQYKNTFLKLILESGFEM